MVKKKVAVAGAVRIYASHGKLTLQCKIYDGVFWGKNLNILVLLSLARWLGSNLRKSVQFQFQFYFILFYRGALAT